MQCFVPCFSSFWVGLERGARTGKVREKGSRQASIYRGEKDAEEGGEKFRSKTSYEFWNPSGFENRTPWLEGKWVKILKLSALRKCTKFIKPLEKSKSESHINRSCRIDKGRFPKGFI